MRTAGIVTGRQRPDTASGVVFVTLEDETGCVNVIVWRDLVERQRRELLGARLLGVYGRVEREGDGRAPDRRAAGRTTAALLGDLRWRARATSTGRSVASDRAFTMQPESGFAVNTL